MEKLLTIVTLGQRAYGGWLFQRLLLGIMVVAGLALVIVLMVSATLLGGLVAGYFALLSYGMQPLAAMTITGVGAGLTIVALVIGTLAYLRYLRRVPRMLLKRSPLTSRLMGALDAFADGLMAE